VDLNLSREVAMLALNGIFANKTVCAMGSLNNVDRIETVLEIFGYSLDYGINNNLKLQGEQIINEKKYIIISPCQLLEKHGIDNVVILIFSDHYWCEMLEQLQALGYKHNRNIYVLEAIDSSKRQIDILMAGKSAIRKMKEKYPDKTHFLVMYGPMGDNFYFFSFYKQYLKKNQISSYVIVGSRVTHKIAKLYKEERFYEVDIGDIWAMEVFCRFCSKQQSNIKFLQIWDVRFHFNPCRIRLSPEFSFLDSFRCYSYGLPEYCKPNFPPMSHYDKAKEFFVKNNVRIGRTVILSPYAYSISAHPPEFFWENLVKEIRRKEYDILLNVDKNNKSEKCLDDLPLLDAPLEYIRECVELGGVFIAMRSGLCDVVGSVNARKFILYPKWNGRINYNLHRPDIEFGSVVRMGICSDASEMEFESGNIDESYWSNIIGNIMLGIT